jgi:predicted DNA-binding transcriptional regulator YafY
VGQRSQTETLAGVYQAFLERRTWKQAELARQLGVGVEALRRILFELRANGMPLDREDDHPHVYWSVPRDWFPGSVLFKREEVPELLRQLRRVPQGIGRKRLLDLVLSRLPRVDSGATPTAVVTREASPQEEQYLGAVEDSASRKVALFMRYYTASRGEIGERHVSIHRVLVGPPSRFIATCHRTGPQLKTFRVDGIVLARLDETVAFRACDPAAVDAYVRESIDGYHGTGTSKPVSFVVRNPEARWAKNNLLEGMSAEDISDGVRVTANTAAIGRIARFVVGFGAAAVAETPALADAVRELASGALGQSGETPRDPAAGERSTSSG